jgi:hypothetical protein
MSRKNEEELQNYNTHLYVKQNQISVLNSTYISPSTIMPHARNKNTDCPLVAITMYLRKQVERHLKQHDKDS